MWSNGLWSASPVCWAEITVSFTVDIFSQMIIRKTFLSAFNWYYIVPIIKNLINFQVIDLLTRSFQNFTRVLRWLTSHGVVLSIVSFRTHLKINWNEGSIKEHRILTLSSRAFWNFFFSVSILLFSKASCCSSRACKNYVTNNILTSQNYFRPYMKLQTQNTNYPADYFRKLRADYMTLCTGLCCMNISSVISV